MMYTRGGGRNSLEKQRILQCTSKVWIHCS